MAEEGEIDVLGDFDLKLEIESDIYDTNELPSKSANLQPEFTNPPWMLEQGWPLDSSMDEKSKATIEKMLLEEQYYINGKSAGQRSKRFPVLPVTQPKSNDIQKKIKDPKKSSWTEEEKKLFHRGMEIYGRSWTKIAEIIPTRTSIQIKNFAHQFFKNQKKENSPIPYSTESSDSYRAEHKDPLTETLAKVKTGNTTITEHVLPRKGRIPKVQREQDTVKPHGNSHQKGKSVSPPKQHKHDTVKLGSPKNKKLIQRSDKKLMEPGGQNSKLPHSLEGLNLMSSDFSCSISPELLDRKMTITPGIIENLDRFCAVADIIDRGTDELEDDDIDIENDDENDVNLVLQNRSTSPNSVYGKLIAEANLVDVNDTGQSMETIHSSVGKLDCLNEKLGVDQNVIYPNFQNKINTKVGGTENIETEGDETQTEFSADENEVKVTKQDISEKGGVETEEKNLSLKSEDPPKAFVNVMFNSDGSIVHFQIPVEEKIVEQTVITDEEKRIHKDFFERNSSTKTPERYLKIRNYLLDAWNRVKPNYLNKTSVRSGLKNCGDVNCIGRVHAYLECVGAINFDCDQAPYRHLRPIFQLSQKDRNKDSNTEINSARLEAMRPRKRKVKDSLGFWIDEKELEGKTIQHEKKDEEKDTKQCKPLARSVYNPFKLIPCLSFSETSPPPFHVEIHNSCLIVMDIHSHISKTEVIGMLGGRFCEMQGKLTIMMATPCNSISTGLQCEMDPVSQTQASEEIRDSGLEVVGWYHSHPMFAPNPSIRDIETQLKFQDWFAKGGSNFVGVIVSPYNPRNHILCSEINCITVSSEVSTLLNCNIPYRFVPTTKPCGVDEVNSIILTAQDLATSYTSNPHRVDLNSAYSVGRGITCMEKMLESLKVHYPEQGNLDILDSIRKLFNTTSDSLDKDTKTSRQISLSTDRTLT